MVPIKVRPGELKLGDVVTDAVKHSPWGTAIVRRVTKDTVTFFRPYGVSEDFSYTGGVICYTGVEEFTINKSLDETFTLVERKELK